MRGHLATALLAASTGSSVNAIAKTIGVSQSTLSRLIASGHRVDPDTLHALYTRLDRAAGTQILLGHLHDELTRAGASILDWSVQPKEAVDAGDLAVLEAAIGGPDKLPESVAAEMRGMVNHLANLVRHYRETARAEPPAILPAPFGEDQAKWQQEMQENQDRDLAAEPPPPPYTATSKSVPHPLQDALRAKAAGGTPKPPAGR